MATLALLSVLLYLPSLSHGFKHYDDDSYILENREVQSGLTRQSVDWALKSLECSNWHPVTWFSHELDCELFGLNATGHHATNVLLHALNASLLFLLLLEGTGYVGRSWVVAAVWAAHPLAVESVAWVSERKNVLSMLFLLLAVGAYAWYVLRPSALRYAGLASLFALALMAKPMAITLPAVLLLLDYWPLCRVAGWRAQSQDSPVPQVPAGRLVMEKLPLLLLSIGSAAITIVAQKGTMRSIVSLPLSWRLENASAAYATYLSKIVWPVRLAVLYPHPDAALPVWSYVGALALLLAITFAAWSQRSQRPYMLWGWLLFLGTLVPMIGVLQVGLQAMADRYTYLSMVGILVPAVWLVAELLGRWRWSPLAKGLLTAALIVVLARMTLLQESYWADDLALWSHTHAVTPDNFFADRKLGEALAAQGRTQDALTFLQSALRLNPQDEQSHLNAGAALLQLGQIDDAIRELRAAAELDQEPNLRYSIYLNLATAYVSAGDATQAGANYQRALQADPVAFRRDVTEYERKVAQHPSGDEYFWLAILLGQSGQENEARAAAQKAGQMQPASPQKQALLEQLSVVR